MQMAVGDYKECFKNAKIRGFPFANKVSGQYQRMVENCVFAINAMANKGSFNPINLGEGINTSNPESFHL